MEGRCGDQITHAAAPFIVLSSGEFNTWQQTRPQLLNLQIEVGRGVEWSTERALFTVSNTLLSPYLDSV